MGWGGRHAFSSSLWPAGATVEGRHENDGRWITMVPVHVTEGARMGEGVSRFSAGVVVLRRQGETCRFLLLRAFRYWDFPKGQVEPGEEPIDAARREVMEETGITDLDFRWGFDYRDTPPYGRGKVARYYVAETAEHQVTLSVNPALGRAEHEEFRWVNRAAARDLVVPRVAVILDWAASVAGC